MNKILIVEDEQSIAEMVKLCLCKNGYMCEIVNDGMAATQKIDEKSYDLILLYIFQPHILVSFCLLHFFPLLSLNHTTPLHNHLKSQEYILLFLLSYLKHMYYL